MLSFSFFFHSLEMPIKIIKSFTEEIFLLLVIIVTFVVMS